MLDILPSPLQSTKMKSVGELSGTHARVYGCPAVGDSLLSLKDFTGAVPNLETRRRQPHFRPASI